MPGKKRPRREPSKRKQKQTRTTRRSRKKGKGIEDEEYYHGLLPRDDVESMLKKNGDFLVRLTEVKNEKSYVLSVQWDKPCHYAIYQLDNNKVTIDKEQEFDSIGELVRQCMQKGILLMKKCKLLFPIVRTNWQLNHDQITVEEKLGEGAFGAVHRGTLQLNKENKVKVAIKMSLTGGMSKQQIQEMMKETRIMRQFHHPNIVKFYGVAAEKEPIMIVMELVSSGSLDKYLKKHADTLTNEKLINCCIDAARGIQYLHQKHMIHRDVAARNCLITENEIVKIADFGLSIQGNTYKINENKRLPIKWLAPETIRSRIYSTKSDIWSFGILMWEVFSEGAEPYPGIDSKDVQRNIQHGTHIPNQPPEKMPENIRQTMERCLKLKPEERIDFTEILNCLEIQGSRTRSITGTGSYPLPSTDHSN